MRQLLKGKKAIGWKRVYAKKEGNPRKDNIWFKVRLIAKSYV